MKASKLFFYLCLMLVVWGCNDPKTIIDANTEIVNRNWSYTNKVKFDANITDAALAYNLYLNVRVSSDYKYANMFVLVNTRGPQLNKGPLRCEIKIAEATGEWLGKGSGNMYSYQVSYLRNYHFPAAGIYHFEIEQNMRDNPLHEVSDVGLRVEKAGVK